MSEEDDYMSIKFLSGLAEVGSSSLIHSRSKKREHAVAVKQAREVKRQRDARYERSGIANNDRLQESLQCPIEESNKGFQLLTKMGYVRGQALGKPGQNTRTEPIGICIKNDRGGLGRQEALRELAEQRKTLRRLHQFGNQAATAPLTAEEYRNRATQKAEELFLQGALRRCQLSCENLDAEFGVLTPEILWFWPERPKEVADDEVTTNESDRNEEEEFNNKEKLEMLTGYLRTSYIFCFWCGVRYKDKEDLDANCPGLTRDEH